VGGKNKKKGKENASGMVDFIQMFLESGTMDARGGKKAKKVEGEGA